MKETYRDPGPGKAAAGGGSFKRGRPRAAPAESEEQASGDGEQRALKHPAERVLELSEKPNKALLQELERQKRK